MKGRNEYTENKLAAFAEMLVKRLEEMKSEGWKKGWMSASSNALPQNWNGRPYGGINSFFLFLHSQMNGHNMPVYITFKQLEAINKSIFKDGIIPKDKWDDAVHINKGAKSTLIIYFDVKFKYDNGKYVPENVVNDLELKKMNTAELEKLGITSHALLRTFPVFNIDQTNIAKILPEKYNALQKKYEPSVIEDKAGMFESKALDRMLEKQEWLCPINYTGLSNSAVYRPSTDSITIPRKAQFAIHDDPKNRYLDGMEYYSSLIHEMAHSTGAESRLNRKMDNYAREELVAEMSAAVIGSSMGFDTQSTIKNNIEYLNSWIKDMKENPGIIRTIVGDVTKCCNMMLAEIDKQKLAINEKPLLHFEEEKNTLDKREAEGNEKKVLVSIDLQEKKKAQESDNSFQLDGLDKGKFCVYRGYNNTFKLALSINGEALLPKTISAEDKKLIDNKTVPIEKIILKYYDKEDFMSVGTTRNKSLSL